MVQAIFLGQIVKELKKNVDIHINYVDIQKLGDKLLKCNLFTINQFRETHEN